MLHNFQSIVSLEKVCRQIILVKITLTAEKALFTRMSSWPLFSESILQMNCLILVGKLLLQQKKDEDASKYLSNRALIDSASE